LRQAQDEIVSALERARIHRFSEIFFLDLAEQLWRRVYPAPGPSLLHSEVLQKSAEAGQGMQAALQRGAANLARIKAALAQIENDHPGK
jgi:hypothetical protein